MQDFLLSLNLYDYFCILLLIISLLVGAVKGFVKSLSGLVSLLLSVVVAKIVSVPITLKLYEALSLKEKILEKLEISISEVYINMADASIDELKSSLDVVLSKFSFIGEYISNNAVEDFGVYEILAAKSDTFVTDLSLKLMSHLEPVIIYIISIVIFVFLSVIISIIINIIMNSISSIIQNIPLVGSMNSLLGLCVGGIKGICIIILMTLICFLGVSIFSDTSSSLTKLIIESRIFEIVSNFKNIV